MAEQQKYNTLQERIDNIAKEAEKIYDMKYREEYDEQYRGSYVVINIRDGEASVHEFSEQALLAAQKKDPNGIFHIMRIGPSPTLSLVR